MFIAVLFTIITLLVSAFSIAWIWKGKYKSRFDWLLRVFTSAAALVFALLAGTWVFLSLYLTYIAKALFVFAAIKTFPKPEDRKIFGRRNSKGQVNYNFRVAVLVLFLVLDFVVMKGRFCKEEEVDLSFPVREGRYLVLQGGASPITNYFHRSEPAQRYAIDIVKLNALGNRANGLLPDSLAKYKAFGETVYSPCTGKVAEAEGSLPDNAPRTYDRNKPSGNHIIIECGRAKVLLAHLMSGSVNVKEGQFVKESQVIARVGNSGYTLEPHLHIQAWNKDVPEQALPMFFKGRFLVMNDTFSN